MNHSVMVTRIHSFPSGVLSLAFNSPLSSFNCRETNRYLRGFGRRLTGSRLRLCRLRSLQDSGRSRWQLLLFTILSQEASLFTIPIYRPTQCYHNTQIYQMSDQKRELTGLVPNLTAQWKIPVTPKNDMRMPSRLKM